MHRIVNWLFAGLVCLALPQHIQAADPKPTHVLQPVMLEVQPVRPDGNPWDTGVGAFTRPDPQVTLIRDDPRAIQAATELLIQVTEQRMKDAGQVVDPRFRTLFARSAMTQLRCGVVIDALDNQPLKDARSKFAADTTAASDAALVKLADGGLNVAQGDKVAIFVNDIDLAAHDALGETTIEITKELLLKGEVELKFNAVDSLRLKLVPIKK
jgi:hypothetical protein